MQQRQSNQDKKYNAKVKLLWLQRREGTIKINETGVEVATRQAH